MKSEQLEPKNLRELCEICLPYLTRMGLDADNAAVLQKVFANWLRGPTQLPAREFIVNNLKHKDEIKALQHQGLFHRESEQFRMTFFGFAALLVFRKQGATRLTTAINRVLRTAAMLLKENPSKTSVPLPEFLERAQNRELTEKMKLGLLLSSSAGLGVFQSSAAEAQAMVVISEEIFSTPNVYAAAYQLIKAQCESRAPSSELLFSAFDLKSLALSEETFRNAERALERLTSQPDAAITSARSTLESAFRWIAHQGDKVIANDASFYQMIDICKPLLGLDDEKFYGLTKSIITLCNAVGTLRNHQGDAHGMAPTAIKATRSEARLITGSAVLLAAHLFERYEARLAVRSKQ